MEFVLKLVFTIVFACIFKFAEKDWQIPMIAACIIMAIFDISRKLDKNKTNNG